MELIIKNKKTGKKFVKETISKEYLTAVEEIKRRIKKAGKEQDDFEVLGVKR